MMIYVGDFWSTIVEVFSGDILQSIVVAGG